MVSYSIQFLKKTLQNIRTYLNSARKSMANLIDYIDEANRRLLQNFQFELSNIRREISTKVEQIAQQIFNELTVVRKQLKSIRRRMKRLEQRVNRQDSKCHIIIRNIPIVHDENLQMIFERIAGEIGFRIIHPFIEIYRKEICIEYRHDGSKDNLFVYPPLIEVRFVSVWERTYFMKQYAVHGALRLEQLGFDSASRVFISETVTEDELRMFYLAIDIRHAGLFIYILSWCSVCVHLYVI